MRHGITQGTPNEIMLGAGTIHKGLKKSGSTWNFKESLYGATNGGTKVTITPTFYDIEVDGAYVKAKGLTQKIGEVATLETNVIEITPEMMANGVIGEIDDESDEEYTIINSKSKIEEDDYVDGFAFVGEKLNGEPVIVLFDNALCTSGLTLEGKSKESSVVALTMECYADLTGDDLGKLPYHIYDKK